MRETTIVRFLTGNAEAAELEGNDHGGDLAMNFDVEAPMLLRLFELSPEIQQEAAKTILESDRFGWDDDAIEPALYDLMRGDLEEARSWLIARPGLGRTAMADAEREERASRYRTATVICCIIWLGCAALLLVCNLLGPRFLGSKLGENLSIFGMVFPVIGALLTFFFAYEAGVHR